MELVGETARLEALEAYALLDTPPEPDLDAIARAAARSLGVPIALLSLVDRDRQFFKARVGVDVSETQRSGSFCDAAVRQRGVFVVQDASRDPRFAGHPMVAGWPGLRFYAGAPLISPQGAAIGTLCVLDTQGRGLSDTEAALLDSLGREAMAVLELRRERSAQARLEALVREDVLARLEQISSQIVEFAPTGKDAEAVALLAALADAEAAAEDLAMCLSGSGVKKTGCDLAAIVRASCDVLDARIAIETVGDCRGEWDEALVGYVVTRLLEIAVRKDAARASVSAVGTVEAVVLRIEGVALEGRALIEEAAARVARLHGGRYRRVQASVSMSLPRISHS